MDMSNQHPAYHPYPFSAHVCKITSEIDIAYMDTGTGQPPILMIHGLGSYAPSWTRTIDGLRDRHRCIAPDLPNYGRSTLGDFPITLRWFCDRLTDFFNSLELDSVILAGHSMGAQIALWCSYLKLFPIEKLLLIAPAGFERFTPLEKQWFQSINRPSLIQSLSPGQITRNFQSNFFNGIDDAAFMLEDRMTLMANENAYKLYCKMVPQCTQAMLDEPVWDILPEIETSTLVVFGTHDALIPNTVLHREKNTYDIAWEGTRRLPNGKLAMIPNAGHFPHWEQANLVNDAILAFLK